MEISYYLKRPNSKSTTAIYARISYQGNQLKYYIPEKVDPKFWNKESQRAKETKTFREYPEFNTKLDHISSDIKNVYRKYLNDHAGDSPAPQHLKDLLDIRIKDLQSESKKHINFFSFFEELMNQSKSGTRLSAKSGKPCSKNTVKAYATTLNNLNEFNSSRQMKMDFDSINLAWYNNYLEFLIKEKTFTTNTVGKHIKILKTVLW